MTTDAKKAASAKSSAGRKGTKAVPPVPHTLDSELEAFRAMRKISRRATEKVLDKLIRPA